MGSGLIMMALGVLRFGISSGAYQEFNRIAGYRWSKVDRIGRDPALQYLGPDAEDITLKGVIYPHFKGGLRQVELMRAKAKTAAPLMLVDGLGFVWKKWVILRVEEHKSYFMAEGAPRKIEFTLTLQSYGGDGGSGGLGALL